MTRGLRGGRCVQCEALPTDGAKQLKAAGLSVIARAMGAPLRARGARVGELARADAAVVLGAPLSPSGALTAPLEERVRAGSGLWLEGAADLVCVTGGGPPGRVEADAMAARARELGVARGAIRVERAARTTEENAEFVADLLLAEGRRRIWLVSQPFHLRRARRLFERAGFDAIPLHIEDSLEYRHPGAIRWIAREYGAWAYWLTRRALGRR